MTVILGNAGVSAAVQIFDVCQTIASRCGCLMSTPPQLHIGESTIVVDNLGATRPRGRIEMVVCDPLTL